ncbi:hypothetical protein ABMA09_18305 [Erwinia rhapontici]|uniref:hypothetical protein n=1 Tax=Erwinia rhapontici TaxID=55212 RepID=UPI003D35D689
MLNNKIKAIGFDFWLDENKIRYFKKPMQILANEDGFFSRDMTTEEREIYDAAYADYAITVINAAKSGKTQSLNILWDLVKRGGMPESDYYDIKAYYNGEKRPGHTDVDSAFMGDL